MLLQCYSGLEHIKGITMYKKALASDTLNQEMSEFWFKGAWHEILKN